MNVNDPSITHHYAGVLLVTKDGRMIGQQRDDIPGIDNPGKVATFGGLIDPGETPLQAAVRELVAEETNLLRTPDQLTLFLEDVAWRDLTSEWAGRHFYYTHITDEELANLEVHEGQGWAEIMNEDDKDLVDTWRVVVKLFRETYQAGSTAQPTAA